MSFCLQSSVNFGLWRGGGPGGPGCGFMTCRFHSVIFDSSLRKLLYIYI